MLVRRTAPTKPLESKDLRLSDPNMV
jgi:hypothetical protein